MRKVSLFACGLLVAATPTVAPASDARARRIKVHVHVGGGQAGDRGALMVGAALRESPFFQIVSEPREAELFLEAFSRVSDTPAELRGQPFPPQPCSVLVSHRSLLILPGSVSTHAPTCLEAARKAVRGLAAQLLRRPDPLDGSI